jgi:PAS domain S-box-containing protein
VALVGWLTGHIQLATFIRGRPAMMPGTAVSLLLTGLGAAARADPSLPRLRLRRTIARAAGLVAIAFSAVSLATMLAEARGFRLPSPPSTVVLFSLGAALLGFDLRVGRLHVREAFALAAAFIGLVTLVGHAHGAGEIYQLEHERAVIGVSIPTSIAVLSISAALLLARPGEGVMRLVTSKTPGGLLLRRLGVAAILTPPLLGIAVRASLGRLGLTDEPLTVATLTTAIVPIILLLVGVTAAHVTRMHDELEGSHAELHELFERSADAIFIADLDGRYTDVNRAACEMLGWTREEIIGKTIIDLIPRDEIELLSKSKVTLLAGRGRIDEYHLRRKDGAFLPVEVSAAILPDGRWQGLVRDISARKAAEQAAQRLQAELEKSRESFRLLAENARDLIYRYRVKPPRRFEYVSPAALEMTGYTPEEHYEDPDLGFKMVHAEDRPILEEAQRGGAFERPITLRWTKKDGTVFWAEQRNVGIYGSDGELVAIEGIARDVTDRERAENEQRFLARAGEVIGSSLDVDHILTGAAGLAVAFVADACMIEVADDAHGPVARAWACRTGAAVPVRPGDLRLASSLLDGGRARLVADVTPDALRAIAPSEAHREVLRALAPKSLIAAAMIVRDRLLGAMLFLGSESTRASAPTTSPSRASSRAARPSPSRAHGSTATLGPRCARATRC